MITLNEVYPRETKAELLERLYPELIDYCDYALPQQWLNTVSNGNQAHYDLLRGGTVWNCQINEPLFLIKEAFNIYQQNTNKA